MVDRGVYSCTGLTDIDDILFHVEEQIRSSASFYKPLSFVKETVFKETLSTSFPFLLPSGNLRLQWKWTHLKIYKLLEYISIALWDYQKVIDG